MNHFARLQDSTPGLRKYFHAVYSYMALALVLTGATALLASKSVEFLNTMYVMEGSAPVGIKLAGWLVMLAPLVFIIVLNMRMSRLSFGALRLCFWSYAVLIGLSVTVIFLTYSDASIAQAFFISGGAFALLSLYGHITRQDLSGLGAILSLALIGLIVAMITTIWIHHYGFEMVISVAAVFIFAGLTAYDSQKLKQLYFAYAADDVFGGRLVILGALTLYLDLINLFLNLLTLTGKRRS